MEEQYVPIETPPALVEWKRVVNDAYLLLADIREDAAWQMGVNEWLQHALSLAERVKATPVEEPPSSPSRERVEVLEEQNERLRGLVYALSDALVDEGPDWSNAGIENLRDRCARALPDVEWLQPHLKAPSDGPRERPKRGLELIREIDRRCPVSTDVED